MTHISACLTNSFVFFISTFRRYLGKLQVFSQREQGMISTYRPHFWLQIQVRMNDLVSPEEIATNELSNADCLQLVSHSSLTQVFSRLSLWEKECQIDSHTSSSNFKAAALWHDLRQLLATKPRLSWARRTRIFRKLLPFHKGNHCFSEKIFGKSSPDSRKTLYPCPAWTMARWLSGLQSGSRL